MVAPAEGMFRSGQISGTQWAKLNAQKGRAQQSKMAKFDDKNKDGEGGVQEGPGASPPATHTGHLNSKRDQRANSAIASQPSRGGFVQNGRGGQPRINEINERSQQKPDFPVGAKTKASNAKGSLRKGRIPARGGQYGGGGQQTQ